MRNRKCVSRQGTAALLYFGSPTFLSTSRILHGCYPWRFENSEVVSSYRSINSRCPRVTRDSAFCLHFYSPTRSAAHFLRPGETPVSRRPRVGWQRKEKLTREVLPKVLVGAFAWLVRNRAATRQFNPCRERFCVCMSWHTFYFSQPELGTQTGWFPSLLCCRQCP